MNEEPNGLEPPRLKNEPEPEPQPERRRDADADEAEPFEALVHPEADQPAPPVSENVEPPSEACSLDTEALDASMADASHAAETPGDNTGAAWDVSPSAPTPPASAADPNAPALDALERFATEVANRLDALQAAFEREARAEASREKIVDRLHDELQEYKQDLWLKVMKPVFLDLIQLHDDMGKMADSLEDERAASLLVDFQAGVEDILYRQGVEPFRVEEERFDPRRQRAVSSVPCDDADQAKTIAARNRPGFAIEDRVIRPELVSVYVERRA